MLAFPKPKDDKRQPVEAVRTMPDGREICDLGTAVGKREYRTRVSKMVDRQKGICCLFGYSPLCHPRGLLTGYMPTFEHECGRGAGGSKRDDRIRLPDGTWKNGAAHYDCNNWKGSRYIDYNWRFQRAQTT